MTGKEGTSCLDRGLYLPTANLSRKVPVITTKLREVGLTPTEISKCSITNVIILMEEVCSPKYHGKIGRIRYKLRGNDKDQIEDYHREYSSMLRGELSELTSNPALCLDCVLHRTNGNGNTSSQCRIWHKEEDDHLSSTEEWSLLKMFPIWVVIMGTVDNRQQRHIGLRGLHAVSYPGEQTFDSDGRECMQEATLLVHSGYLLDNPRQILNAWWWLANRKMISFI